QLTHPGAQGVARLFEGGFILDEKRVIAPARDDVEGRLVGLQAADAEPFFHGVDPSGRSSARWRSNNAARLSATRRTRGWCRKSSCTAIHNPCDSRSPSGGVRRMRLGSSAPAKHGMIARPAPPTSAS